MISCELKGASFGVKQNCACFLGDDMGLGYQPLGYPEDANELREALQYIEAPSALVIWHMNCFLGLWSFLIFFCFHIDSANCWIGALGRLVGCMDLCDPQKNDPGIGSRNPNHRALNHQLTVRTCQKAGPGKEGTSSNPSDVGAMLVSVSVYTI